MKTTVTIPDVVFTAAERVAARLGLSRSELYTRALEQFLANQSQDNVTRRLDRIADGIEVADDPALGRDLVHRGAWEW